MRTRWLKHALISAAVSLASLGCVDEPSVGPLSPGPLRGGDDGGDEGGDEGGGDDGGGDDTGAVDDPGALIAVSASSFVGVLLDELPAADRDGIAARFLSREDAFWEARAAMQLEASLYRLVYRNLDYYDPNVGQLPLPPGDQWAFSVGTPERRTVDGHDLVGVEVDFSATLLTGVDQPALSQPELGELGGVRTESFLLPADPELLLERVGYGCLNEADFPPNSIDTENARFFYDDACGADDPSCHPDGLNDPELGCEDALAASVGRVAVDIRFERIPWDADLADAVRTEEMVEGVAQMRALASGLEDNRIVYKYFKEDEDLPDDPFYTDCAIAEGCVGGGGWRRVLQFTATTQNLGTLDLFLGQVDCELAEEDEECVLKEIPVVANRLVTESECHGHMHFNHYGSFGFDAHGDGLDGVGGKKAFCVESTSRTSNHEGSPLVHPYSCHYQGTAAGWGDDYIAGLDCQWVDITDVSAPTGELSFFSNEDGFLCEGTPILDDDGQLTFVEEPEYEVEGMPGVYESSIACDELDGWEADNLVGLEVALPETGGVLTAPCTRGQVGLNRACGFAEASQGLQECASPGAVESVVIAVAEESLGTQVVRICEASRVLGAGTACTAGDALAQGTIAVGEPADLSFTCPRARDAEETGGLYAVYVGQLDGDEAAVDDAITLSGG